MVDYIVWVRVTKILISHINNVCSSLIQVKIVPITLCVQKCGQCTCDELPEKREDQWVCFVVFGEGLKHATK